MNTKLFFTFFFFLISILFTFNNPAQSQEDIFVAPDVDVISVTPVQGAGISIDRVPSNVQIISTDDLNDKKNFSVVETLNKKAAGISISNLNSSPMQNDINFRGYVAGPLLGTAQALAIYQNGMRVNESFGEVVQWDLVPDFAIQNLQLFPGGDPVFGQNAIGGAISMEMKNGFDFNGANSQVSGGTFSRTNEIIEYGQSFGNIGIYVGANFNYDQGFRDHSESYLETVYSDFRFRNENTEIFMNLGQSFTDLNGNGAAPVTLLDLEGRDAVYTHPDNTHNKNYYLNLGGNHFFNDKTSFQGNLYYRHMERRNYNGDEFEGKDCGDTFLGGNGTNNGLLCGEFESAAAGDGVKIFDVSGNDISYTALGFDYESSGNEVDDIGAINRSNTKTNALGFSSQATIDSFFMNRKNTLITGLSYDYSFNSFGSSTELGKISSNRGVQGTGVLLSTDAEGEEQFITNLEAKTHNIGLYASDTLDLDTSTSMNLSLRWNWANLNMDDQNGTALEGDHYFFRINPGVGITKKYGDTTVFASYKESSRTPSVAELSCADPNNPCRLPNSFQADPPLSQVVNRNFELGARGNFSDSLLDLEHKVKWSVNAYAGRNYNDIIFIGGNKVGTGYFRNVGNTQRLGAEFALNGVLGNKWSWFAKYAYVRATFETNQKLSSVGHPENPNDDDDSFAEAELYEAYQIQVGKGDYIPAISPHVGRFGIGYSPIKKLNLNADIIANSAQFYRGDENNAGNKMVPGYFLLNFSADYTLKNNENKNSVVVFIQANNVLDENYETGGIFAENEVDDTGGSGTFVTPGQPFSIFSGVNFQF